MKYIGLFCFCLIPFLFQGCAITTEQKSSVKHVEKFEMEVPAAPETRGANSYMEPNTSSKRLSANIHTWKQEKESLSGIKNKKKSNYHEYANYNVQENVDGSYKIIYPYFTASFEYLNKKEMFLFGTNISINRGLFGSLSLGINTRFLEFGLSAGLWKYFNKYSYSGTEYIHKIRKTEVLFDIDSSVDRDNLESSDITYSENFKSYSSNDFTPVWGAYTSIFLGSLSLNFSFSAYCPNVTYENKSENEQTQADFDFPWVMTEYIAASYRINKHWEIRLGAASIFGNFPGWHWSATGGFSYYTK